MKKRITGLAVVLVLLSAFSAWAAPRLRINTAAISKVMEGETLSVDLDYVSEDLKALTWTVSPTGAQQGLSFNTATAHFEGTAQKVGTYKFTIKGVGSYDVTSTDERAITVTQAYSITVAGWYPTALSLDNTDDPNLVDLSTIAYNSPAGAGGGVSQDFNEIVFHTYASLPIRSFTVDSLPRGLTFTSKDGGNLYGQYGSHDVKIKISGKPTQTGVFSGIKVTVVNDVGRVSSKAYTLRVFDTAKVTTKKLPDMTWGKSYNAILLASGGLSGYPVSWDLGTTAATLTNLPGISFDPETGKLFGTYESNDAANTAVAFGYKKEISVDLQFKPLSPAGTNGTPTEVTHIPLYIKMVAPTILSKDEKQPDFDNLELYLDNDGKISGTGTIHFTASGPGTLSWDVKGLPDGFSSADEAPDGYAINIADTASKAVKKQAISVTAKNMAGSNTVTFYVTLLTKDGASKFGIKDKDVSLPEGNMALEIDPASKDQVAAWKKAKTANNGKNGTWTAHSDAAAIEAYPGPVKWTATNLPSGLFLSLDKSNSYDCIVYVVGSLDKASTKADQTYTITARNAVLGTADSLTRTITIYASPDIKTATPKKGDTYGSLPAMTLGRNYSIKVDANGLNNSMDVAFAATSGDSDWATTGTYDDGEVEFTEGQTDEEGGKLTYNRRTRTISGKLYRFPAKPSSQDETVGSIKIPKYTGKMFVRIFASNPQLQEVSRDAIILVKGEAPKFKTTKLSDFAGSGSDVDEEGERHTLIVTGTKPIDMLAYVSSADAKKFGLNPTEDIIADGGDSRLLKITVTSDDSDPTQTKLKIGYGADQGYAFTSLPLTISLDNGAGKPVVQKVMLNVKGATPEIVPVTRAYTVSVGNPPSLISADFTKSSKDVTLYFAAGGTVEVPFIASGDQPFIVTSSDKKNGIEVVSADGQIKIQGTPTANKETKTTVTITLTNPSTKAKAVRKVTIVGMVKPTITSKGSALIKEVDLTKSYSIKLAATGTKPITWSLDVLNAEGVAMESKDYEPLYGIKWNPLTGVLYGIGVTPTSKDHKYKPISLDFYAVNAAGPSTKATVKFGIRGAKPKLLTSAVTIKIRSSDFKVDPSSDLTLKTSISPTDQKADIRWAKLKGYTLPKPITGLNVSSSDTRNWGTIVSGSVTSPTGGIYATKGSVLKVSIDNVGSVITGNVKVIVQDPAPSFDVPSKITIKASQSSKKTATAKFTIKPGYMTGDTGMTWKLIGPNSGPVKASIKAATKNTGATVTLTVSQGVKSGDFKADANGNMVYHASFAVTAMNTSTKASTTASVSVDVVPYNVNYTPTDSNALPEDVSALPEDKSEIDYEDLPLGEGTVTYGNARTESALTQAERRTLAEGGYIIAAILPEITADEEGLYELEAVSLDEAAPEGYELVWFAFPRNAEPSDDDEIIEFYDEAGAEISVVPEGKVVVPAPWLNADVTYAPVIAVRAPVAGNAKDSLDEAEAGDTVTEKAIEEAAKATE